MRVSGADRAGSMSQDAFRPRQKSDKSCLTLGIVPYLNVQPLIWAIEPANTDFDQITVIPEIPRKLAANLAAGAYDCAIVPVFEYFRHPDLYTYVPGTAIAARGRVDSVMLYSSEPVSQLKTVYLDASSLTSVHLFQVIAAEAGLHLTYLDTAKHPVPRPLPPATGWVVIGDPAIAETGKHPHALDLARAWTDLTSLPFVFAAWLVPDGTTKPGLTDLLMSALLDGLKRLPQVAADSAHAFSVTPDFALDYFQNSIHYGLGEKELAGWREFGRLCFKHGLIDKNPALRPYKF
jgi:chorismate dehydratase